MTVQTAQRAPHSQLTSQQTNQRLIHPWTGATAILEEPQLIQGSKKKFYVRLSSEQTLQGVTTVETILGDALDAKLAGYRTAGFINVIKASCMLCLLFIIFFLSGSADSTTLSTFHAELV